MPGADRANGTGEGAPFDSRPLDADVVPILVIGFVADDALGVTGFVDEMAGQDGPCSAWVKVFGSPSRLKGLICPPTDSYSKSMKSDTGAPGRLWSTGRPLGFVRSGWRSQSIACRAGLAVVGDGSATVCRTMPQRHKAIPRTISPFLCCTFMSVLLGRFFAGFFLTSRLGTSRGLTALLLLFHQPNHRSRQRIAEEDEERNRSRAGGAFLAHPAFPGSLPKRPPASRKVRGPLLCSA